MAAEIIGNDRADEDYKSILLQKFILSKRQVDVDAFGLWFPGFQEPQTPAKYCLTQRSQRRPFL